MKIKVEGLKHSYTSGIPVVHIPSLAIESGETLFIQGPSGSGKTTLLNILAGILAPSEGKIFYDTTDFLSLSARKRDHFRGENIGYIFQDFNLINYLSAKENIDLPIKMNLRQSPSSERDNLMKTLGLWEFKDRRGDQLSLGQKQRVAAARAVIGNPPLVIADEPTSSLDQKNTNIFMEHLLKLQAQHKFTLLFVSHDDRLANLFPRQFQLEAMT